MTGSDELSSCGHSAELTERAANDHRQPERHYRSENSTCPYPKSSAAEDTL